LITSNQRRRGLTPKLMSYMSATAGCDREQSEAPINNNISIYIYNFLPQTSTNAKPHRSGALHRHSFEPAIASTH
jgi:hypothetical protein